MGLGCCSSNPVSAKKDTRNSNTPSNNRNEKCNTKNIDRDNTDDENDRILESISIY